MVFAEQNAFNTTDVFNTGIGVEGVFGRSEYAKSEEDSPDLTSMFNDTYSRIMGNGSFFQKETIIGKVLLFFSGAIKTGLEIITKAIKVAIFKFGIELCAMSIKSLVETMIGMSLQPPSIDTKGVFYNAGTPGTTQNNHTSSGYNRNGYSQPTLDNPFGNPFGAF